jgi:allantoicase
VLAADQQHFFERDIRDLVPVTHARFNIFPDGGVSRLRICGTPGPAARMAEGLRWLNALTEEEANTRLLDCCGSANWARHMAAQRPYLSPQQLFEAAGKLWCGLSRADWLEAFGGHPRIGERKAAGQPGAAAAQWSEQEQSSVRGAPAQILGALAEANRAYEARFGYIFIVCATGKSAEEILGLLEQRLKNSPEMELRIAAEEQQKIMRLRLEKFFLL